jgi:hypothetical protein
VTAAPVACCDLHGRFCEPPSELCCYACTEGTHPLHADGSTCSAPDLSRFADHPYGDPAHLTAAEADASRAYRGCPLGMHAPGEPSYELVARLT